MIEVLQKHIDARTKGALCSVARWILTLSKAEQQAFSNIMEDSSKISIANLYNDLNAANPLPFKLTAFRSHLRKYCTCQK